MPKSESTTPKPEQKCMPGRYAQAYIPLSRTSRGSRYCLMQLLAVGVRIEANVELTLE
jgi:hypothetical protein